MFVTTAVVSLLLAAAISWSAARKLSLDEEVVQSYGRVGVPAGRLKHLAALLLVAAGGLLVGLLWPPIGIAAATGLTVYFAIAVGFHVRYHDTARMGTPATLAVVSAAVLVLHLSSS